MTAIPHRKIGNVSVPAIGFGVMGISTAYGTVGTDEERLKVGVTEQANNIGSLLVILQVLDAAYDAGCTFWDTANVYGDSEDLIGKWYEALECLPFFSS